MTPVTDILTPTIHGAPERSAAPPVGADAPERPRTRKRRAYDVWERDTLPNADDGADRWHRIAEEVEATSRGAAIDGVTQGRPGHFGTVLVGEFVEEDRDDPQGVLVAAIEEEMVDLLGGPALLSAGVTSEQIRAAAREAITRTGATGA